MARKFKKSGSIKPVYRSTRRRRYGGEAQPVIVVSETTEHLESGKAEPVYVVDDAYVNRYGVKSGAAIPVVEKTNKGTVSGRAKPVYVISGSFNGGSTPTPPPAFVGALDSVSNLSHVYWLHRLLSSYTGDLLRLRRDSDDAELDFGYIADGSLDTSAISTWLAGSAGYAVTLYDQIGSDDITQATAGRQPVLNLSDAGINNKASMSFVGDWIQGAFTNGGIQSQPFTAYIIFKNESIATQSRVFVADNDTNALFVVYRRNAGDDYAMSLGATLKGGTADGAWKLQTALANGASSQFWWNGISQASGDAGAGTLSGLTIGTNFDGGVPLVGRGVGVIMVDANSADVDKNTVGNDISNAIYGLLYTDT